MNYEPRLKWLLLLAYVGFISLGLPDAVIGVAWPSIRHTFPLPLDALGPYFMAGTTGYVLSSFHSGKAIGRWGIGVILAYSSLLTALTLFGYALTPAWTFMIALSFMGGLGAGAIDAAINLFAAVRFTSRHVSWLHACWGVGAATGAAIMSGLLNTGLSWRVGYLAIAALLLALTVGYFAAIPSWQLSETPHAESAGRAARRSTLKRPVTWLSMGLFFIYCGIETSAGQWSYSLLVESRQVTPATAGLWVCLYWASLTGGRFLIGAITNHIPPVRLLRLALTGVLIGLGLLALRTPYSLEAPGLAITGFSLAVIYPTLIAQTPFRFPASHVPNVVGFQVASAGIGLAILPALTGVAARHAGLNILPGLLIGLTLAFLALHELVVYLLSKTALHAKG